MRGLVFFAAAVYFGALNPHFREQVKCIVESDI
jgi:hypothetical protein